MNGVNIYQNEMLSPHIRKTDKSKIYENDFAHYDENMLLQQQITLTSAEIHIDKSDTKVN